MFQTIPFSGFRVRFSVNGTDLYKWLSRFRDEITSPEFCLPFAHTVNRPDCRWKWWTTLVIYGLVFTCDGVWVGVVIRSLKSLWSSSVPIPLTTPSLTFCLWFSENQIVGVGSRSGRTTPITNRGNVHCDWFILSLLLPTLIIWFSLDHKRNASDGVVSGVGRKWKRSDSSDSDSVALVTPLTTPIFYFH